MDKQRNPISPNYAKRMRLRAIRLQSELALAELEQLIHEEPASAIRDCMTEANIALHTARQRLVSLAERID